MPAILINLAAAADAQARADEGVTPLPGDAELIANYEGFCQQEWERFEEARYRAERAAYLAEQCRHCGPDGATGPDCGNCPEGQEQ